MKPIPGCLQRTEYTAKKEKDVQILDSQGHDKAHRTYCCQLLTLTGRSKRGRVLANAVSGSPLTMGDTQEEAPRWIIRSILPLAPFQMECDFVRLGQSRRTGQSLQIPIRRAFPRKLRTLIELRISTSTGCRLQGADGPCLKPSGGTDLSTSAALSHGLGSR